MCWNKSKEAWDPDRSELSDPVRNSGRRRRLWLCQRQEDQAGVHATVLPETAVGQFALRTAKPGIADADFTGDNARDGLRRTALAK